MYVYQINENINIITTWVKMRKAKINLKQKYYAVLHYDNKKSSRSRVKDEQPVIKDYVNC